MLSNTNHVLDKSAPIEMGDRGTDSQFGFQFQRRTRSLLEDVNRETLLQSMAHFGPQSIRTSSEFSQTHE